jgi:hypothetical protein
MSWERLEREIDAWAAVGRTASAWWRDDDAVCNTSALDRLIAVTGSARIPLALAVIPAKADQSLFAAISKNRNVTVLQHGYAHINHAAPEMRAVECGGARPLEEVAAELAMGRTRLTAIYGDQFLPVLVPPWNRIEAALLPRLPDLGFLGLSTWGPRSDTDPVPGLEQVNTHADPISWRKGRIFAGAEQVADALAQHLAARREGGVDPDEPTGLLTHHLAHDEPGWLFLKELAERLGSRPGLRWLSAQEAFGRVL